MAVADRLSFSRAAAELGMSQPAVSQAIARLERALALRLFDRSSRGVQLTEAGKLLLPHAEALREDASAFAAEATRLASPAAERAIRLAYCPLVGTLAARVVRRLAGGRTAAGRTGAGRPAGVELRAAGWRAASEALQQSTVSAALMSRPFPAGFASTARFRLPVRHLAVPAASPLATAARLGLEQLARQDVLMPRHRPPGSLWAQLDARLAGRARFVDEDLDDLPAALDLVAAGRGVLPAPELLVETVRRPDLRFVRFDAPGLGVGYGLVWRQQDASAELMALVQAAQEVHRNRSIG